jgi:hypothetical protein
MIRTQIQLTEKQAELLREMSARRGVSIATLVRQAVDGILARSGESSREDLYRRATRPVGRFRSGKRDVSARHDEYLAEDLAE